MLASDVVNALANGIVSQTDNYTTNIAVNSLTSVNNVVTCETATDHGMVVGRNFVMTGALTPLEIDTFTRSGTVGTITTLNDHDATTGIPVNADVEGATEPEFNGSFVITRVVNRRTLEVEMIDAGPVAATGVPVLTNASNACGIYNGAFTVTAVNSTTEFEYQTELPIPSSTAIGAPELRTNARVVASVTIDRIIDMYTDNPPTDYYLYVVLDDVPANKNRGIFTDAVDDIQLSQEYTQQIIQGCSVYLVIPASTEVSGALARDEAERQFALICKSILFKPFDSMLHNGASRPLQFVGHGFAIYNAAYYMHSYSFQQVAEMVFDDTVGYDVDVAFRDISMTQSIDTGTIETEMNLDEESLP